MLGDTNITEHVNFMNKIILHLRMELGRTIPTAKRLSLCPFTRFSAEYPASLSCVLL